MHISCNNPLWSGGMQFWQGDLPFYLFLTMMKLIQQGQTYSGWCKKADAELNSSNEFGKEMNEKGFQLAV